MDRLTNFAPGPQVFEIDVGPRTTNKKIFFCTLNYCICTKYVAASRFPIFPNMLPHAPLRCWHRCVRSILCQKLNAVYGKKCIL